MSTNGAKTSVLVVDDEFLNGEFIQTALETYRDLDVLVAHSADEAMKVIEAPSVSIDLVLTDIVMGGSSTGLKLADDIKKDYPDIRVILMTGYSKPLIASAHQQTFRLLSKPFLADQLLEAVDAELSCRAAGL